MELTEEVKQRMERNRLQAKALLEERQKAERLKKSCQNILSDNGNLCGCPDVDLEYLECLEERVCISCKNTDKCFDLLSKTQAQEEYLITSDTFQLLKHITRENPRNSHWTSMKLYMRKHAIDLAIKRFGSLEKLEEEKHKRQVASFEREKRVVESMLGESSSNPVTQSETKASKSKSRKRTLDLVSDVMAVIQGDKKSDQKKNKKDV